MRRVLRSLKFAELDLEAFHMNMSALSNKEPRNNGPCAQCHHVRQGDRQEWSVRQAVTFAPHTSVYRYICSRKENLFTFWSGCHQRRLLQNHTAYTSIYAQSRTTVAVRTPKPRHTAAGVPNDIAINPPKFRTSDGATRFRGSDGLGIPEPATS
jgi:hypothetical protein